MVRLLDTLTGLLALAALPAIFWWGIYQGPGNAANLEAVLQSRAAQALERAGIAWAVVRFDGQRATLSGPAPSEDAIAEAADIVLGSNGPGGLIFGGVTQVASAATAAPPVSPYDWRATRMPGGQIVLTGYAPSRIVRDSIRADAERISPGLVDDRMQLAGGAPSGNWQGVARFALSQLDQLDSGYVQLTDHRLVLVGEAGEASARREAMAAIGGVAAPFRGRAIVTGNAAWTAERREDELVLSGRVGSGAERRMILALAERPDPDRLLDEMEEAEDAALPSGWLAGVEALLPQFSRFDKGVLRFDEDLSLFTVEGTAPASAIVFLEEEASALNLPFRAILLVQPRTRALTADEAPGSFFDRQACEDALNAVVSRRAELFTGRQGRLSRTEAETFDTLADIAGGCNPVHLIEIEGPDPGRLAPELVREISRTRAERLAQILIAGGLAPERVAATAYGASRLTGDNEDTPSMSGVTPVRFRVLEAEGQ